MVIIMKLVIGGYAQGKLFYVLEKYGLQEAAVLDGVLPDDRVSGQKTMVINHLNHWVKGRILDGGYPEKEIETFLNHFEDCILISDEIGNGIVPFDVFEREYRERMGRILIRLAERAEEVERVICGIGQKIK